MNIEDRYKHDATFNRVVDQMRALLSMYHVTPSELREAVILAATMHMNENIQPLYISRMNNAYPVSSYYNYGWANPPTVFGGIDPIGCATPKAPVVCDCTKELGKVAPKLSPMPHVITKRYDKKDQWCINCHRSETYISHFKLVNCTGKP